MKNRDRQLSLFGEPDQLESALVRRQETSSLSGLDERSSDSSEPGTLPFPASPYDSSLDDQDQSDDERASIFDEEESEIFERRDHSNTKESDYPTVGGLDLTKVREVRFAYNRLDALVLHYDLEQRLGATVDLTLTNNRRRLFSVKGRQRRIQFRLHYLFVFAPKEVIDGIEKLARGNSDGRAVIQSYIDKIAPLIDERTDIVVKPQGEIYDLDELLTEAIAEAESLGIAGASETDKPQITWGRESRGRRTIRYGSYAASEQLIRVHPRLDQDWIPRYFVAYVVFHEYLHHLIPPEIVDGRRNIHTPTFNRAERRYKDFERATDWERANIKAILKS